VSERSDRVIAGWLALLLFGVYLLSFSGQIYSQDGLSMFSVTESFVKRGEFNTDQLWTLFKARDEIAPDGESYAKYGYGTSLLAAPLYAVALALPELGLVQTTLLTSAIVIAISGALLFLTARRLDYARRVSLVAALLFGLATPAWVYAKQIWSEPFALATLLAAFYALLCFRRSGKSRDVLFAAVALGLAVATRVTNAALVPFFALYGFWGARREARIRRGLLLFALMLALAALSIAWYDWVRYGNPLATGYRADEQFDNPLLLGLYGLLFSPGKGLFVYVPFLAVLAWSAGAFYRRARAEALLILGMVSLYLVLFSTWYYWWGGTNWGPRFLVPMLPFLVLAVAPAVELVLERRSLMQNQENLATSFEKHIHEGTRRTLGETLGSFVSLRGRFQCTAAERTARLAFAVLFGALCFASVVIQLLGVTVPALAYRLHLLSLSTRQDWDAIFVPRFSALVGSWSLLRPRALDLAWIRWAGSGVQVDWLVPGLTAAFVLLCCMMLFGGRWEIRPMRLALGIALALAVGLSLFSLYRYRDDVRFGGIDPYRALVRLVEQEARPGDVLILNNDVMAPFFLNENRARIRWYGLSRDPAQWDEPTRGLLARLARSRPRIWFAYDDSTAHLPDPTQAWLDETLTRMRQDDLGAGVHLALFESGAKP
jgi:hypothetical protein